MSIDVPARVDRPLILHADCLDAMRRLPDGCINLVVTDPPYFRVKDEEWDRQWENADKFLAWMRELVDGWRRVLAPNGSVYVFASPQMAARVECLIASQFSVLNHIVWAKPEGKWMQTKREAQRAYFPATERIIFAEQQCADMTAMGLNGYKTQCEKLRGFVFEPLRSYLSDEWARAGLTPCDLNECTSSQMAGHYLTSVQWALPTAEKYALMQARANRSAVVGSGVSGDKHLRREYEDLRREYEDLRRPFAVTAAVHHTDVWTFPTVKRYPGKHPCEKPRPMLDHIIKASTRPNDVVMDCFLGSGVSGEAAVALGRRFVGFERGDYVHAARRRVARAVGTPESAAAANVEAPVGAQLGLL